MKRTALTYSSILVKVYLYALDEYTIISFSCPSSAVASTWIHFATVCGFYNSLLPVVKVLDS